MNILVNGNFLARGITGIERFAFCILKELDVLLTPQDSIALYAPKNSIFLPQYKNIKIIKSKYRAVCFPLWDNVIFFFACLKMHATSLDFANTTPFFRPGLAFLHDIYFVLFPKDATRLKDKLIALYSRIMYRTIAKRAKKVLTVSFSSKLDIQKVYHIPQDKIAVIPNGYDHFNSIAVDKTIFNDLQCIKQGEYFFTLGSLSKRKNLFWLLEVAKNNPQYTFVISGKPISCMQVAGLKDTKQGKTQSKNVIFTGYIKDTQVKALMTYCKAFIFPSYYEGFGIPPLEALSCGAKVITACIPSQKEIFKDSVCYIDPYNTNVNLQMLLNKKTAPSSKVLEQYTYKNSAVLLKAVLCDAQK